MSIWLCIPSARKPAEANPILHQWRAKGYKVAVFRDPDAPAVESDKTIFDTYQGCAVSFNRLVRLVTNTDPTVEWFVYGGDDIVPASPDPRRIAAECREHFAGTNGVMQPCGDAYGALADRSAATSAWVGRAFVRSTYGGCGPLWEGYKHYYDDTELAAVATRLGKIWWRTDLTQYHHHYLRQGKVLPDHLIKWQFESAKSKAMFDERKRNNFPGHESKGYNFKCQSQQTSSASI